MEKKYESVTLSLETYEDMKAELKRLREQVKEKTIIKYQMHPIYGQIGVFILFGVYIFMMVYDFL